MKKIWRKIKSYIQTFNELTKTYNPELLASAVVFYLLLVLLPLSALLFYALSFFNIDSEYKELLIVPDGFPVDFVSGVILVINLLWVSSRFLNALNIVSDTVYQDVKPRSGWWRRLYSFILMIVFIALVIIILVLLLIFSYVVDYILQTRIFNNQPILIALIHFVQLLIQFGAIWLLISFIYKFTIPVKVKIKSVLKTCLLVVTAWTIITFIFQSFIITTQQESYTVLYGALANVFLFLFWLYLMAYVFIFGLIYQYYLYRKKRIN